jgi:hypothetical protein
MNPGRCTWAGLNDTVSVSKELGEGPFARGGYGDSPAAAATSTAPAAAATSTSASATAATTAAG